MLLIDNRIESFVKLGDWIGKELERFRNSSAGELKRYMDKAKAENAWFTESEILRSLEAIRNWLTEDQLKSWSQTYFLSEPVTPKNVAVIMAGNIPMVNFHDFISVLITGHYFIGKLSSQDKVLIPMLANQLITFNEDWKNRISFTDERLTRFDAVIATGSNNSARYFEYYFGPYPHIIRKNRHSIAVLNGNETEGELLHLYHDLFDYYGLGCRNVSMLWLPQGYSLNELFDRWENLPKPADHHKYRNNYDYYRSIYLLNNQPFLDTGYASWLKSDVLASPISVIHYQEYADLQEVENYILSQSDAIQCVVSNAFLKNMETIPFGQSQCPGLTDYPDGVDIIQFLLAL